MSKFCINCGNEMKDDENFCSKCGTKSGLSKPGIPIINTDAIVKGLTDIKNSAEQISAEKNWKIRVIEYITEKNTRIGIMISSGVLILSTLLPYLSVNLFGQKESISLLKAGDQIGDGIIYIILGILCLIFLFKNMNLPLLISGVLPVLTCFYEQKQFRALYETYGGYSDIIHKELGYYLNLFSSLFLLALSIWCYVLTRESKKAEAKEA